MHARAAFTFNVACCTCMLHVTCCALQVGVLSDVRFKLHVCAPLSSRRFLSSRSFFSRLFSSFCRSFSCTTCQHQIDRGSRHGCSGPEPSFVSLLRRSPWRAAPGSVRRSPAEVAASSPNPPKTLKLGGRRCGSVGGDGDPANKKARLCPTFLNFGEARRRSAASAVELRKDMSSCSC